MNDRFPSDGDPEDAGNAHGDGDALVTIRKVRSEFEANLLVAALEEANIPARAFSHVHSVLPINLRHLDIPVQVRKSDEARARVVLDELRAAGDQTDWDSVDLGEREDTLPLRQPGRMPIAAKIAFGVAVGLLLLIVLGIVFAITFGASP